MNYNFLEPEDIVILNNIQSETFGGDPSIKDMKALESACMVPRGSFEGIDLYVGIFEKAAAYWFFLSQDHPFIDGNKRAALLSMLLFLQRNGYTFGGRPNEVLGMAKGISTGVVKDTKEITRFIIMNCSIYTNVMIKLSNNEDVTLGGDMRQEIFYFLGDYNEVLRELAK